MADEPLDQKNKADEDNVDLSSLSSFSLGPDWVSGNKPKTRLPKETFEDEKKGSRGQHRDRRGPPARKRARFDRDRKGRPPRREGGDRFEKREPFKPILAVDFYPEEEPFKVLSQAIKTSCRTFELFEIARLILEKPERFVCVARDPSQKEGEPAKLWACVPDGLPFLSEEEALSHTFHHYMGEFFNMETVEGNPPTGSFQMVHKCGMTGELLAPPNYHRYQAICREHHAAKLSHVPYSRFEQRIESSREQEDVEAWLNSMKTRTRYIAKDNPDTVFDTLEDARLHLVTQAKDKLVRPAYSARFSGKSLALLNPGNPIRRSVEYLLEGQKRFPLDTANHLRGRLRRMNFAVYKRGSKGVSFVCAVKRHFRKPDEVLADNLQKLIDFLEAKPNFPAKDLPSAYLKIESPQEDAEEIKKLRKDLRYLVTQGYVIEYSDGRLFVPPIREDEVRHLEKLKKAEKENEAGKDEQVGKDKPADKAEEAAEQQSEPKPAPDQEEKEAEEETVKAKKKVSKKVTKKKETPPDADREPDKEPDTSSTEKDDPAGEPAGETEEKTGAETAADDQESEKAVAEEKQSTDEEEKQSTNEGEKQELSPKKAVNEPDS